MLRQVGRVWGVVLVLVLVLLGFSQPAWGRPFYGSHACFNCHGGPGGNDPRLSVEGADTTANPIERPGAIDRGTRPVYVVSQGQIKRLQVGVGDLGQGTSYDVVVTNGFQPMGVTAGGPITFTPDPDWTTRTNGNTTWYSRAPADPHDPFEWNGPVSYTFDITPSLTTAPDYYDFAFEWAGKFGTDTGLQSFYVQVVPVPEPAMPAIFTLVLSVMLARRR
jgi:hypothetical protein